ncbi:MAG: sugar phosphate isomerase/epimerase [Acidobacteriaceae bacterium]|nr:sugar phosphate isomerase/epimerase [Acidobacteriaceae bacterium]MBV9295591.1 sugar phosphate isomerase/epimerase [Acidobacteriaceae bacterium]
MSKTRRAFVSTIGGVAAFMTHPTPLRANPLNKPIGLQLYTVGDQLGKDFKGTLKQIAAIGYAEVELAQTFNKSAGELRASFSNAGLTCRSAHMFDFQRTPAQFMDFAKELGARYVVTSFNPPPSAFAALSGKPDVNAFMKVLERMTLDDYKRSAETSNELGRQAHERGLQYAYHNHNLEFKKFGDVTAYDTLLRSTDPELVKMEMDCGWVSAAGYDPVEYLKKYPDRIRLLHIKAFKSGPPSLNLSGPEAPKPTELGRGGIDYKRVFEAAKSGHVEQYYVEQEPPFTEMSAMEAIKLDYEFLHHL